MEQHADLERVAAAVAEYEDRDSAATKLPVLLRLLGREREASAIVERQLRHVDSNAGPYAEMYRDFATRFTASVPRAPDRQS